MGVSLGILRQRDLLSRLVSPTVSVNTAVEIWLTKANCPARLSDLFATEGEVKRMCNGCLSRDIKAERLAISS
ncbi:hypothetical protein J6590_103826, partial [Homalodisca vitripennis]